VDGLWVTNSEGVELIVRAISFQDLQLVVLIHQRHRQTDRQMTCDRKTALSTTVHRTVMKVSTATYTDKATRQAAYTRASKSKWHKKMYERKQLSSWSDRFNERLRKTTYNF